MRSIETDDRQQPNSTRDTEETPEPRRRIFVEPALTRHDRVTRIHLISDAFGGSGHGGSGGTFF